MQHSVELKVWLYSMVLACFALACSVCARALDPSLDISQYAHTAWKVREGFSKGGISSIAQSPDGYIWLGTDFGLLRFDGVRSVPWEPPQNQHLPSNMVYSLLAARDGTLWIGTMKGLASWKDGKLREYTELAGQVIYALLEDHEGTIWVGGVGIPPPGKICAIQNGKVRCSQEDGSLGAGVLKLYEDSKGILWAATTTGLWRWKPGKAQYYPLTAETNGWLGSLRENSDGTILIGTRNGVQQLVNGKIEVYPLPGAVQQFDVRRLLNDGDGGLWIGTADRGILHVHAEKTDVLGSSGGLSSDLINDLFEDREGNIWVATVNGLDRFREFAVTTFSAKQGLSNAAVQSILADKNGGIWMGTVGGLDRWKNGIITTYDGRDGKLDGLPPNSLFQDSRGRIWVSTRRNFGYLENDRFVPLSDIPGGFVSIAEDSTGNLWIATQNQDLIGLRDGKASRHIPWSGLGHKDFATALAADGHGGLWLGFFNGGLAYFTDGGIHASYTSVDGLGDGRVNNLRADRDGVLWASTDGGLSRLKNGHIATLSSKQGLPCETVHWAIEDDDRSFWLYMPCGLVRIARSEMDRWVAAADENKNTEHSVHVMVFDSSHGVRMIPTIGLGSQVAKSSDGKLWFLPWDGVSVIDPRHLPFNKLPPPVHIEQIVADHKTYDATPDSSGGVSLPPHVRDLQIDYTALSFVAPEKVLFRYKLQGWDRDWLDAGMRRQAFYSNLPPRNYTFRVTACNNSGVWSEPGTSLNFFVAPAYYQTWWFRSVCVIAFLGLLVALYQMRLRRLAQQFTMRLEARVDERTRIARELHDTLLQSFQGVLLKFHAVTYVILDRPAEAQKTIERVIDQARQAITEGRDAVQGLRAPGLIGNDIAQALSVLGKDLASEQNGVPRPEFGVQVEGTPRNLSPLLRDDIYRIGCEALRNAFQHAHAGRIEVEIRYDPRQLRLRIRDDGKGIDPKVLDAGGKVGHYGLPGMHERAKLVGGKLEVWSELDSGTETELSIPASVVYEKSNAIRHPL